MKNFKKLSRGELKSLNGGFTCYCGTQNAGEFTYLQICIAYCKAILTPIKIPTVG
ncbi:hypothetical protein M2347_003825 [Chryseobacterium sp. H1D6B]|uniref:bacteriocin-like protein n=1 Tax=Chryseobacterium sp. H1D6B TaxID=2940588 RepID=UPI0015CB1078|nr:hypothetical protein [Chryseobacterium sp. H1D6B]MDH6254098.1 hypothetical protein [Chryseobacterium sp. H1D6B]